MIRDIDLGLLRSFIAVAESGSMTAAANRLHLTQGAVSQQVGRLEDVLGEALFVRDRRGVRFTNAGERLLGTAKRLIAANDEILAEFRSPAITGEVRLGVPFDLVGTHVPPILRRFAEQYPRVDVRLVCAASPELSERLAAGAVDLALVEQPLHAAGGECLAVERLLWVGARGGNAFAKRPLPLSIVSEGCVFRPAVLEALSDREIAWRTVFESGSIEATGATVRMDLAVTAWLASTIPAGLEALDAACGLPALPPFAITLHGASRAAKTPCKELAQTLRDAYLGRIDASP